MMSDEDDSASAFVMQWRWPIKYKTALSVMRLHCHLCNYPPHTHTLARLQEKEHVSNATSIRHICGVTLTYIAWVPSVSPSPLKRHQPTPLRPPLQCTVLHFVSSDYRSLQSCSRSALVATTKTRRPKPCDRWAHVVRRCPAKCRQHSSVCGLVAAQMFACVLRWNCWCPAERASEGCLSRQRSLSLSPQPPATVSISCNARRRHGGIFFETDDWSLRPSVPLQHTFSSPCEMSIWALTRRTSRTRVHLASV